ncbi:MAG: HisA/HisF-related TIM barrel protein [Planctomycetota bacterium]
MIGEHSSSQDVVLPKTPIPVIPVVDLKSGKAVQAIGGRRSEYRPWESSLCPLGDPLQLARSVALRVGHRRLYVADIDALEGRLPQRATLERLADRAQIVCDAGLRNAQGARELLAWLRCEVRGGLAVLASESLESQAAILSLSGQGELEHCVFSFDWKGPKLLSPGEWLASDNWLDRAVWMSDLGIRRFVLIDLRAVGRPSGPTLTTRCRQLRSRLPHAEIMAGGGVRSYDDLRQLASAGCSSALVATALHGRK